MKTSSRPTTIRNVRRHSFAKRIGSYEALEKRQVMANNFLAGTAFIDADSDGKLGTNEIYLPGATIELRSAVGGTLYDTQVTDSQGAYLFTNVSPGDYKLVNLSAPSYAASSSQALSSISTVTGTSLNSIDVTLRSPVDLQASVDMDRFTNDIGIFEDVTVSIGGHTVAKKIGQLPVKVYGSTLSPNPSAEFLTLSTDLFNGLAAGNNGPYDVSANLNPVGSGSPHNGPRVAFLYNHFGQVQQNSVAAAALQLAVWELLYDADNSAPYGDLASGNFSVIAASSDTIFAAQTYLSDSLNKSEVATFLNAPNQPSVPTINGAQGIIVSGSFNFGNVPAAKIGDLVWHDKNVNGRQESNEPRIAGATVNLYQDSTLIATATTNSSGIYLFDHLLAGNYKVEFLMPNGFTLASPRNNAVDNVDSDGPLSDIITLVTGQIDNTVDQGFYNRASLGDFVWNDRNGNGFQTPDEEGIANARVNLIQNNVIVDTKTTDSTGRYFFTDIQPGVYNVEFIRPDGYAYTSPQGQESGPFDSDGPLARNINLESSEIETTIDQGFYGGGTIGDYVWHDLDADGIQDANESGIDGVSVSLMQDAFVIASTQTTNGGLYTFSVAPGTYSIKFTKPTDYSNVSPTDATGDELDSDGLNTASVSVVSDETNNSLDVGFYNLAKIGNYVWHDLDADGIQDADESGIDGVNVSLMQGTTEVATTQTAGGGLYSFSVTPGTYTVKFTKPAAYSNVSTTGATPDGLTSAPVTVLSGATNDALDIGFFNLATIGNYAWHDLDADGIQDANESGIDGVSVSLMQGTTEVATTQTVGGGFYSFSVTPGTYTVKFTKPAAYSNVSTTGATPDGLTSAPVTVLSGATNNALDIGFFNLATIGNYVWHDLDADGIQDANESGIDGVSVSLMQGTTEVATTQTAGGGLYSFSVTPGTYTVKFTKPAAYSNVSTTGATPDGLTSATVTVLSGATNNALDIGFFNLATIGNYVWHDLDADGIQDADESGIDGVNVSLMQGTTEVATTQTAGGGFYSFSVTPGAYTVKFTKPVAYSNNNTPGTTDGDLPPAPISLLSGVTNNSLDTGFYNLATIGNYVWNDLDADGIQDANESGIDGVSVSLMQGTTQIATTQTAGGGLYSFSVIPGTYTVKFTKPTSYSNVSPTDATSDDLDSDGLTTAPVTVISGTINNRLDQGFYNLANNVCVTIDMQGNTSTTGTHGNVRTFSAGGVSVNASAFSRTSTGTWAAAYLGSYGGGLGVTDSSEDGSSTSHTLDNTGRLNYVLFEFSQQVVVDAAFLGYVVTDSDMTVWIGNATNAFSNHQSLSDAFLQGLGFSEVNTTTSAAARTADINATSIRGNILVIAAQVDDTSPEDYFKIANLTVCVPAGLGSASLGDLVWHDINGNGIQESNEPGIAGSTVTLIGGGADNLINGVGDTTTISSTDSNGKYSFLNLIPGNQYKVNFSLPSGYDAATARKAGTNTTLDSDGTSSDIVVLAAGENNTSIDAGFIKYVKVGNYLWNDLDRDGLQENGEVGIAGVQLTLSGTSGSGASISQTTTTASNGSYQFTTLPGTYTVSIAASNFSTGGALAAFTASPTAVGTNRGLDSNANPSPTSPATLTSGGSDLTVDFGYFTTTSLACVTMKMEGNSATSGTAGNIRTFTAGGISVKASGFARDSWGSWSLAYLGSYAGGLGVTDNSEGSGGNSTHTVDNVGRRNYILFEFSQVVTIDSAFLGYVITDSDLTAWIGTVTDPFNSHRNLSDSYLSGLGYSEFNDTTLTTTRTADLNAGNRSGNVLVIAASTSGTANDWFKLAELALCATVPTSSAGTKFFVVDDDSDKTFKYTSSVQYTSNFAAGATSPSGIAANPSGTNTWISDLSGRIYKYDNDGLLNSSWSTSVASTQGVSTNGTSVWTVSNSSDRVYFYSGAASFVPSSAKLNPTLTSSFALHSSNTNPKDLASDGTFVWVVDDNTVDLIYKYSVSGSYLGRWQLDTANSKPTGITIDPTGGSKIWIVDSGTDRIYEYSGATGCLSGGLIAAKSYALHTGLGNTNPQGIADPPTGDGDGLELSEALAASLLVDGSFVNPAINPYHNSLSATDVNDDGLTTAIDALMIINRLNTGAAEQLSIEAVSTGVRLDYADVNNDGSVSPLDALLIINQINLGSVAIERPIEPSPSDPSDSSTGAADSLFGELGSSAEGEMVAVAYLFDSDGDIDGLRRRR